MIVFKYLTKEVIATLFATTFILMLIFMSTQFVHYLGDAAFGGRYSSSVVFHIMVLQVPYLLGLLLPLGFYLAVLTAYGRLHADRELMVLYSCGMSEWRLLSMTMSMAVVVAIIVGILTCGLSPYVAKAQKDLVEQAKSQPLVETIMPGRFYSLEGGRKVFYIESVSRDHKYLKNIFVATLSAQAQKTGKNNWGLVSADKGYQVQKNDHVLKVMDGYRYQGTPGDNNYQVQHFDKLSWHLPHQMVDYGHEPEVIPTMQLLTEGMSNLDDVAELQWRFSMPLSVFLLALLALPLSKVNPRQGKFAQFLPAVLIYIFYANMMFVGRSWIQSGAVPPWLGLWWLHGALLLTAVTIIFLRSPWKNIVWKKYFAVGRSKQIGRENS
jgi:lipopolysaccharide export system permease protein